MTDKVEITQLQIDGKVRPTERAELLCMMWG